MALLGASAKTGNTKDRGELRVHPVTVKLTRKERDQVTSFASSQGVPRGRWMREILLGALEGQPPEDPALAEIVGVRLLLVNVLRFLVTGQRQTPESFDRLLDEIARVKRELARKIQVESRR